MVPHAAQWRVHAVAVEFDLVQPLIAFRRRVDQLGELRRHPFRQGRRVRTARYRPRHAGPELRNRRMRPTAEHRDPPFWFPGPSKIEMPDYRLPWARVH